MDCSTPGFPILHYLLEFAQTHVHWVNDAIQPSYPLSPFSPSAFGLSPKSGSFPTSQFFTSGVQSIGASALALAVNIELISFRIDWFDLKRLSRLFSSPTAQKHQFFGAQLSLWLVQLSHLVHDCWKNHSFDYSDLCWQSDVSAF